MTGAEDFQEGKLLLIDKPLDWTSFDVVNFIRSFLKKIYGIRKLKVGHAGTLDPLATGLLVVCTGKKTKEIDRYQGMDKIYTGSMVLGATTPSYDLETEVDARYNTSHIDEALLRNIAREFIGEIEQVPPAYSAVKIQGERAFKLARKNKEIKLKSRKVNISRFELLSIGDLNVDFLVACSKGTYIRSLVHDFGQRIHSGAYLSSLRRTGIGHYRVEDAQSLEDFKAKILSAISGDEK
ncbi:MAG: tRNA pseudouridine(55) synthase TruB [bacterium]|jgi:tRNA pseudouridine55 synthase